MNKAYWLNRWRVGDIRFNESFPHRFLLKYASLFAPGGTGCVLVPFCGASIDMSWLIGQGNSVLGIEVSPIAIGKFFSDHKMPFSFFQQNTLSLYQFEKCSIIEADLFTVSKRQLPTISACYDRGGFTALPPETLRRQYVSWIKMNLSEARHILLVTFEHGNHAAVEPPFSVNTDELIGYFGDDFHVSCLERETIPEVKPHWRERGVFDLYECAHLLEPRR